MNPTAVRTSLCFAASLAILAALILAAVLVVAPDPAEAEEAHDTAYRQAVDVARAADRGDEIPEVLGCAEAIDRPSRTVDA